MQIRRIDEVPIINQKVAKYLGFSVAIRKREDEITFHGGITFSVSCLLVQSVGRFARIPDVHFGRGWETWKNK